MQASACKRLPQPWLSAGNDNQRRVPPMASPRVPGTAPLRQDETITRSVSEAVSALGGRDILVKSAAIGVGGPVADLDVHQHQT